MDGHGLRRDAERLGCDAVHLASGVGPARSGAHRRYLGVGYVISAHHFAREVPPTS